MCLQDVSNVVRNIDLSAGGRASFITKVVFQVAQHDILDNVFSLSQSLRERFVRHFSA